MLKTLTEDIYFQTCNNFNTALVDGDFPASGSFIDVSDFEKFAFVVRAGTLDSELTLKVQQADAIDGTPKDVTGATDVVAATDDNDLFIVEVETNHLDINNDYHFVTLDVAGAAGSNDYLDILFVGILKGSLPVTQPATVNVTRVMG